MRQVANFPSPIFTYSGQGTMKRGVNPGEHTIAYAYGSAPQQLRGELTLAKEPICIVTTDDHRPISKAARICFGIYHPVQYNVKVKDIGYVRPDCMPAFLSYFNMEQNTADGRETKVTTQYGEDHGNKDEEPDGDEYDAAVDRRYTLT
jgi:hypothetical protein